MSEPNRTVVWLCVSTDEQASPNRTSLDTQLSTCRAHTADDIIAAVLRPPTEEGFSRFYGSVDQMCAAYPPYKQLVELIVSRTVTRAVALNYSRYWRTDALATQLIAIAEEADVWLYSCEEPYSRETWMQNPWLRMVHAVSAEEAVRKLARDRRRGLAGRAERGLPVQSTRPYGYRLLGRGKDRQLLSLDDERPHLATLMEWRALGWGASRALRELERRGIPGKDGRPWTRKAIWLIWHNPTYAGYSQVRLWPRRPKTPRRGEPIIHTGKGKHEPLISEELWQAVQRVNEVQARDYARGDGETHLFTGLCRCGYCGKAMRYRVYPTRRTRGLCCNGYDKSGGKECRHNGYPEQRLRRLVVAKLKAMLADPEAWAASAEEADQADERQRHIDALEREIAGIDSRRRNLLEAVETAAGSADRSQFLERYDALGERRAQCAAELQRLRQAGVWIRSARERLVSWQEAAEHLEAWSDGELRSRLLQLIDHIELRHGEPPVIVLAGE